MCSPSSLRLKIELNLTERIPMLVLSRQEGEQIMVGDDITIGEDAPVNGPRDCEVVF